MRNWRGVLCVEDTQTGDGRIILSGATSWRPLPFALKPGHDTETAIGNVASITRVGKDITATGVLDDSTPEGADIARMLDEGTAPLGTRWGLSIEPDDVKVEVVNTNPSDAEDEIGILIASGRPAASLWRRLLAAAGEGDVEGEVMYEDSTDVIVSRFTALRISGVALVPVAAFDGAYLELDAVDMATDVPPHDWVDEDGDGMCDVCGLDRAGHDAAQPAPADAAIAAAAAPLIPPRSWFYEPEPEDGDERLVPQYDIRTGEYIGDAVPLYIGDDGQVYGHVAPANRCHVGIDGMCVTPPASASAYSHFHIGYTVTTGGDVHTGVLCAGCDHAAILGMDERMAKDWYANIGFGWAHVRVTPGRFGPWACGALRPGVTEELVYTLRGGGISGDWRGDSNGFELIGVLAVNIPGFTVQRAQVASAGGLQIPAARAAIQFVGGSVRVITGPVMPTTYAPILEAVTASACSCGAGPSEELRLLRAINARTLALNPTRREQAAARLRR